MLQVSEIFSCRIYMASSIKTRDYAVHKVGSKPGMLVPGKLVPKDTQVCLVLFTTLLD